MNPALEIMNSCYDKATTYLQDGKYEQAQGANMVGNLINNLHHSIPFSEWSASAVSVTEKMLVNENSTLTDEQLEGYREATSSMMKILSKY